jgi:hypothetical protein
MRSYLKEKVAAPVYKSENMAVGIHHADYVASFIRGGGGELTTPTNSGCSVGIVWWIYLNIFDEYVIIYYIIIVYILYVILQNPVALCILTLCSLSSPSLCNPVNILIFTFYCLHLFSLYNTTCFCVTGHHDVYTMVDSRNLLLYYHTHLLFMLMQNSSKIFYFRLSLDYHVITLFVPKCLVYFFLMCWLYPFVLFVSETNITHVCSWSDTFFFTFGCCILLHIYLTGSSWHRQSQSFNTLTLFYFLFLLTSSQHH